jgi:hypothetical protein
MNPQSLRFREFTIIDHGVRVRITPRESFGDWISMILEISQMPIQIPICLRAAAQVYQRLAEEAARSRNEFPIAELPSFKRMIVEAGFHIALNRDEIEFLESRPDSQDLSEEDAEKLWAIRTWLLTDAEDAVAKIKVENFEAVLAIVKQFLDGI